MTTTDFAVQISDLRTEDRCGYLNRDTPCPWALYDVTVTGPNLTGTMVMHISHGHANTHGRTVFVVNGITYKVTESFGPDGDLSTVRTWSQETGRAATPDVKRQIVKALTVAAREFVTDKRIAAQRMMNADAAVAAAEQALTAAKAERDAAYHALAAL